MATLLLLLNRKRSFSRFVLSYYVIGDFHLILLILAWWLFGNLKITYQERIGQGVSLKDGILPIELHPTYVGNKQKLHNLNYRATLKTYRKSLMMYLHHTFGITMRPTCVMILELARKYVMKRGTKYLENVADSSKIVFSVMFSGSAGGEI